MYTSVCLYPLLVQCVSRCTTFHWRSHTGKWTETRRLRLCYQGVGREPGISCGHNIQKIPRVLIHFRIHDFQSTIERGGEQVESGWLHNNDSISACVTNPYNNSIECDPSTIRMIIILARDWTCCQLKSQPTFFKFSQWSKCVLPRRRNLKTKPLKK